MALRKIQKEVDVWIKQYKIGYFKPHENLARLPEEVGEVAREVNHKFGPKKKKLTESESDLGEELADIIFTVVCLANSLKIDLDKSFDKVMRKVNIRDKERYEKK